MTEEQEDAKNWRMLQQRNQIKGKLARLEDEMKRFAESWKTMERFFSSPSGRSFKVDEKNIHVFNDRGDLGRVPLTHFNQEKIEDLIADFETSSEELQEANKRLKALGVD